MTTKNKIDFQSVILALLAKKDTINVLEIMRHAELPDSPANRRAVQRALNELMKNNKVLAQGHARARIYQKAPEKMASQFQQIALSKESKALLHYLSQPVTTRQAIKYQTNFLRSYQPNKTNYLGATIRQELLTAGNAEPAIHPAGTYARAIFNKLLIDLSWNSSRLEGNTYSLLETKQLIEQGKEATGKAALETQMILNHKNTIEYIMESVNEKNLTVYEIRSIHALLSENLLGDSGASGRVRDLAVGISGSAYTPLDNPHLLKECLELCVEKLNLIENPFEQSFFALIHLSYLQAFVDVNKRTARLTANIPLIKHNLKPLSFINVNQREYATALLGVYEKNDVSLFRDFYVWAYKQSAQQYSALQQTMDGPNLFKLKYRELIHGVVRTVILEKIPESQATQKIKELIALHAPTESDAAQLLQLIETEIMNLHDGNIARYKIRPSEFLAWRNEK